MKTKNTEFLEIKTELQDVFSKCIELCVVYIKSNSSGLDLHFKIMGKDQSIIRFYDMLQKNLVLNDILSKPHLKENKCNRLLNDLECNIKAKSEMELKAKLGYIKLLF